MRPHPHLTVLSDASLGRELGGPKGIEPSLQAGAATLAYPYGEHEPRVRAAARAAGYDHVCAPGRKGDSYALLAFDLYRSPPPRSFIRALGRRLSRVLRTLSGP